MWERAAAAIVRTGQPGAGAPRLERRRIVATRMFHRVIRAIGHVRDEEAGQALVEYSLVLVLIAVVAIGAVSVFGVDVSKLYQSVVDAYP
jgi:Flp pilus assembly pilin Flp